MGYARVPRRVKVRGRIANVTHYEGAGVFGLRDADGAFTEHRDRLTFLPGPRIFLWDGVDDDPESA